MVHLEGPQIQSFLPLLQPTDQNSLIKFLILKFNKFTVEIKILLLIPKFFYVCLVIIALNFLHSCWNKTLYAHFITLRLFHHFIYLFHHIPFFFFRKAAFCLIIIILIIIITLTITISFTIATFDIYSTWQHSFLNKTLLDYPNCSRYIFLVNERRGNIKNNKNLKILGKEFV